MSNYGILALDPGGTTGWASFQCDQIWNPIDEVFEYVGRQWTCGQLDLRPEDHHLTLYNLLGHFHVDKYMIVCERFDYRNKSRPGLELISREYIGVTRLFCQDRRIPLALQEASQGKITDKSFVKKENLQRLALWTPGWGHAMDAYGHLLWYMINHAHVLRDELLAKGWR